VSETLTRAQKLPAAMTKAANDLFAPFPLDGEQR
jgi:hypothetical protein